MRFLSDAGDHFRATLAPWGLYEWQWHVLGWTVHRRLHLGDPSLPWVFAPMHYELSETVAAILAIDRALD